MRNHIQGLFLICLLVAALWGVTRLAGATLGDAFADNGTAQDTDDDLIDLTVDRESLGEPLTEEELKRLQFQLARAGFLDVRTDVDGLWGDITRGAIEAAIAEWGLDSPSNREVLVHADELFADVPLFAET